MTSTKLLKKSAEYKKPLCLPFIAYEKAFDFV